MPAVGNELPIDEGASALDMANAIMGDGVTVTGATYTGWSESSGIYTNGDSVAPGVTPSDTGVILSTGRASDITRSNGDPNRQGNESTNTSGPNNDADFNALAGASTYDASFIEISFIPTGDTLSMQFVFASDEYPEFSNSIYNDAVGVWINDTNVPFAVGDPSVGGVNQSNNVNLYNDNTNDDYNTEMDGFTVTMTMSIPVIPGQVNTIKIGIADVADANYDSSLLIAGDSMQTVFDAGDDSTRLDPNGTKILDVLANDSSSNAGAITITHINGQPVVAGDTITLTTGQTVTLNADGTLTLVGDADEESFSFTYTAEDAAGVSDTAFVLVDQVPCFVAGTLIRTPRGEVPVEALGPGDLVDTLDDGPQPIRWAGRRTVAAEGDMAPVRIAGGTYGPHRMIEVSPQHRVLIRSVEAELMFGSGEVLVKAKDLVDGAAVRRREGGDVTYVHLLFDRHQVLWSEGLPTESFLPGPQTAHVLAEAEMAEEIARLFPELDLETGQGYGPAARPALRAFEGRLLVA